MRIPITGIGLMTIKLNIGNEAHHMPTRTSITLNQPKKGALRRVGKLSGQAHTHTSLIKDSVTTWVRTPNKPSYSPPDSACVHVLITSCTDQHPLGTHLVQAKANATSTAPAPLPGIIISGPVQTSVLIFSTDEVDGPHNQPTWVPGINEVRNTVRTLSTLVPLSHKVGFAPVGAAAIIS